MSVQVDNILENGNVKLDDTLDNMSIFEQKIKSIELQDFIEKTDSCESYIQNVFR